MRSAWRTQAAACPEGSAVACWASSGWSRRYSAACTRSESRGGSSSGHCCTACRETPTARASADGVPPSSSIAVCFSMREVKHSSDECASPLQGAFHTMERMSESADHEPSFDTYGQRLRWAMHVRDVRRNADLAEAIGRSEARVGQVLRAGSFDAEGHVLAARWLRVSSEWLALGEGEPPRRGEAPAGGVVSFLPSDPVLKRAVQLLREADPETRVKCLEAIARVVERAGAASARQKTSGE